MAGINLFHFTPGETFLYRVHPSLKILAAILFSGLIIRIPPPSLILLSFIELGLLTLILKKHPTTLFSLIKESRIIIWILILVIVSRSISLEENSWKGFFLFSGFKSGLIYAWRFVDIIVLGQIFLMTTSSTQLFSAIYNPLRRIPHFPAGKIALMVNLTITFIPVISDYYQEIHDAWLSRGGENLKKKPLRAIKTLLLPLFLAIFRMADELTMAMESRCYTETPTPKEIPLTKVDGAFTLTSIFAFLLTIGLSYLNLLQNSVNL